MAKAMTLSTERGDPGGTIIHCPACKYGHLFDARWKFNGDFEKPTFTPSMLVFPDAEFNKKFNCIRCHSFVTDGKIQFLADCDHSMAGQTVELPDV